MKICFVMYGNNLGYIQFAERMVNFLKKYIDAKFCIYNELWLSRQFEFIEKTKFFIYDKRGGGYWSWKPYIILDAVKNNLDYDLFIYMDVNLYLLVKPHIFLNKIINVLKNKLMCFREYPEKNYIWTKRDCFIRMECDKNKYWNSMQVNASMVAFMNKIESINFIKEWSEYCMDIYCVADYPSELGKNLPGFKDHRHDQSILSILQCKYNIIPEPSHCEFDGIITKQWSEQVKINMEL
jgi:hypothetical protein